MSRTINYKEKYEKALKAITELLNKGDREGLTIVSYRKDFEEIFPELVNSNERIRRKIIALVNAHGQSIYKDDMINWLEKLKVFTEHGDGLYYFTNNEFTYVGYKPI